MTEINFDEIYNKINSKLSLYNKDNDEQSATFCNLYSIYISLTLGKKKDDLKNLNQQLLLDSCDDNDDNNDFAKIEKSNEMLEKKHNLLDEINQLQNSEIELLEKKNKNIDDKHEQLLMENQYLKLSILGILVIYAILR